MVCTIFHKDISVKQCFSRDFGGKTSKIPILLAEPCCNTEITSKFVRDVTAVRNWDSFTDFVGVFSDTV